jgi:hypothetical protein
MTQLTKDPDAVLNYGFDWADGGANDGATTDTGWLQSDTITGSAWAVSGPDAALVVDSDTNDDTSTAATLSGGTAGRTYTVTNHITTASGNEDDRSLSIRVYNK